MKIVIMAQAFHAAQQNAAVKDVRFALNGVYLAPNGDCVGTDGHTLAVTPNAGDFADIPHRLIKIKDAIPVNALHIELDTEARVASFINTRLGEIKRVGYEFEREEFRYPDYTRTFPKNTAAKEVIGLDPVYLARAAKVFRDTKGVRIEFGKEPNDPVVLTTALSETKMLIMPVRL